MSAPTTRGVYFSEDVCERLQISRSTLKRLRRVGAFPIPELKSLDRRPRWAIADVEAFLAHRQPQSARLRLAGQGNRVAGQPR